MTPPVRRAATTTWSMPNSRKWMTTRHKTCLSHVIPAKAGTHLLPLPLCGTVGRWTPAFAGVTWKSWRGPHDHRSEEHTSELQSLMRISYAVFCLKKKKHLYYICK